MDRIRVGDIVRLKKDWETDAYKGIYKQCFIPKGTKLKFVGKSLYAHFKLLNFIPTWKDGKDTLVLIPYKQVFKILEEGSDE